MTSDGEMAVDAREMRRSDIRIIEGFDPDFPKAD